VSPANRRPDLRRPQISINPEIQGFLQGPPCIRYHADAIALDSTPQEMIQPRTNQNRGILSQQAGSPGNRRPPGSANPFHLFDGTVFELVYDQFDTWKKRCYLIVSGCNSYSHCSCSVMQTSCQQQNPCISPDTGPRKQTPRAKRKRPHQHACIMQLQNCLRPSPPLHPSPPPPTHT
jgi:hypothetical protein